MSKGLPKRLDDFSGWYNELVKKADLAENSSVRGCMVIKPYGFSLWEKMQSKLDTMFKETGPRHNPTFKIQVQIPKSKKYIGSGKSKKIAQQNAASQLIKNLNIN